MEMTGMKHIKVLGITGGVGAGKSTILDYLEKKYSVRVIQLDQAAHLLMEPGQPCYEKIVERFGRKILAPDETIDRKLLYQETFSDRQKVEELNRIVHPLVKEYVREQIKIETEADQIPFLVIEAALLLEDHYEEICDTIWYVYVDPKVRIRRLEQSRGYTPEKTAQILKNQKSDEEFRLYCQFVIDNSSDFIENTYEQIDKGLKEYGFL